MPGVNVGRVGHGYAPAAIAASRATGIRCTYFPDTPVSEGRIWLGSLRALGLKILMALDNDTHDWYSSNDPMEQWRNGVLRARDAYGDYVDEWQGLNEPDALWDPLDPKSAVERRAMKDEHGNPRAQYSWILDPDEVSTRLRIMRTVLGHRAVIVGPGLSSGHPEYAHLVDWAPVDKLAVHPYAKQPDSPELIAMMDGYRALRYPITISEYDASTAGMHQWMADNQPDAYAFCWTDQMVPGHGMIERPDRYAEFVASNTRQEPEPLSPGRPSRTFASEPDALHWAQERRWKLLADLDYVPENGMAKRWRSNPEIGAPVDAEHYVKDEQGQVVLAVQPFTNAVLVWRPDMDLAEIHAE